MPSSRYKIEDRAYVYIYTYRLVENRILKIIKNTKTVSLLGIIQTKW